MKKDLSVIEASAIITGYGIGSGVLAMPYVASKCGFPLAILIIAISFVFSFLLHLMIADLAIKSESDGQILNIITKYLKEGKLKKAATVILYIILAIVLYANLAIYICGSSDILYELIDIPKDICKIIFYLFAAFVALLGLKILGLCEKYAIVAILIVLLILSIASVFNVNNDLYYKLYNAKDLLSLFGVVMFSFAAFFSVPQVVVGLNKDKKRVRLSILLGMLLNMIIMVIVVLFSMITSKQLTEVSIIGWTKGIGYWAQIVGSMFTILAMLTSYWSISLALKDITIEATKLNPKLAFIVASIPSLIISFIPSTGFIGFLEITSGACAILIIIFLMPIFHKSKDKDSILGHFACLPVEIIVFIAYIAMAIGSII